ncbi:MAG: cysteine--tRNA ligase, partial [Bacteroidales bacterium]|nr:cysteine--tRNA ligase [Bacteroidales bacterium]
EFFNGTHEKLERAYSPMTIRFFILQAHYRSTVDFSNDALQAAEKGFARLVDAYNRLQKIMPSASSTVEVKGLRERCEEAMCDDLNTPIVISNLFDATKAINSVTDGKATISKEDLDELKQTFEVFVKDILGLRVEESNNTQDKAYKGAVDLLLEIRKQAKANKDWATSDKIRDELANLGFSVKDTKDGFEWSL